MRWYAEVGGSGGVGCGDVVVIWCSEILTRYWRRALGGRPVRRFLVPPL